LSESLSKLQRKKERKNDQGSQKLTRSWEKGEKMNERRFVATIDEALSYEKGEMEKKNNPQRMHQTVKG